MVAPHQDAQLAHHQAYGHQNLDVLTYSTLVFLCRKDYLLFPVVFFIILTLTILIVFIPVMRFFI